MTAISARKFMLIAGEASGDTLGAELVTALKREIDVNRPPEFIGAGGSRMAAAGVRLDFDLTTHAVVGIWEVLKNYGKFKGFFDRLLGLASSERPDAIILIDYPGFNLRFAKAVRELVRKREFGDWNPKIIYYVSPQIWAWHESRVHQIARDIDLLLAIFPFEQAWYRERAPELPVKFVGHPVIDRYASQIRKPKENCPSGNPPLVLLLPGSRERELRKHLPVMIGALRRLELSRPLRFRMIVPDEKLKRLASSYSFPELKIQTTGLDQLLAEADVAIASSGTVTMECAYFGVPTVVIYKTSWSTYQLGRRFIKVKYLAMPNILADELIYPELIQEQATPENIAKTTGDLLTDSARRVSIQAKLGKVIQSLGAPGASGRAAREIAALFSA